MKNKRLPNIFINDINKDINNCQKFYYTDKKEDILPNKKWIKDSISKMINPKVHNFKQDVTIRLKDKVVDKTIISKDNISIMTLDGDNILIDDILDIKEK